ncbi:MAG: hypothetical protein ACLUUL_06705 [Gemmiger sp.]
MKKWIVAAVVVVIIIAAAVWYKARSSSAVVETPETAATPAPTATPTPTPEPTPTATPVNADSLEYEFDLYVETYKYDNGITDEDLRNNQDTRYAMYEEIYLSGYDPDDARSDQEAGCTNEFLAGFLDYVQVRNTTGFNTETETTDENVDKDSPEYIKKAYNQEGKTLNDGLKAQGIYQDEDGVFRWPGGDPVTFDDPDNSPEGFTYEARPEDNPNVMTEEDQQKVDDIFEGKNPDVNAVIDKYFPAN